MKIVKQALAHRIFLSVAFSDTGAVRGMRVHTLSLILALVTLLAFIMGSTFFTVTSRITGEEQNLSSYLKEMAGLKEQQGRFNEEQVRILAEEMGVIKARLDRFDMIGQRLFTNELISEHVDEMVEAQGGPESDLSFETLPSLEDITSQLDVLAGQIERVEGYMTSGLQLVAKQEQGNTSMPRVWPVLHERTRLTSNYGWREDPFSGRRDWHGGVDIGAGWNAPIVSSADGIVVFAGYRFGYGLMVEVQHAGGYATRYGHMAKISVKNGETVVGGLDVRKMGSSGRSTGPHLHFEVLVDDEKVNPYPFVRDDRLLARQRARNMQLAQK
jgi:murein DD-endopeptidase MepM/ murein hydrolase activator NlpD